jgi:hypothetical protein
MNETAQSPHLVLLELYLPGIFFDGIDVFPDDGILRKSHASSLQTRSFWGESSRRKAMLDMGSTDLGSPITPQL